MEKPRSKSRYSHSSPKCRTDQDARPPKSQKQDNKEFSFHNYRKELDQIFFREKNFGDIEDFWVFVRKYESLQRKQPFSDHGNKINSFGIPEVFDKMHCVCLRMRESPRELASRISSVDNRVYSILTTERISKFQDIFLLYLDFKQKEKMLKLRKLRQSQKNLPVYNYRQTIVDSVLKEQVVIIAGDTGCGKSTQVPQYLLKAGFQKIACTQPRRIACICLSKRVAYETLNEYGSDIGYQIRFEKHKTQSTKIIFITEGLLLRQVATDPMLSSYNVIVLDEVHERHLHGDFLLGVVKCLLYQRPDLKVVLMSATINIQLFQNYFPESTVIQVPGRLFPINLHYRPISSEEASTKSERLNPAPYVRILQLIDEKYAKSERGDVLIFLSGMSEISTVVEAAQMYAQQTQSWIILPLHSSLSLADQDKVFDYPPEGVRKCIISTNIAETSITIDGIRFVVDSGKVKEMSYDASCKMQKLKEFWVSQASAEQRKGRAGRTGPGVCYRLYSEDQYNSMDEYSKPEIQRVPLDSLLLQMLAMGLPDARKFPFIEAPSLDSIETSLQSLKQQGALDNLENLTTVGQMLSQLPVDIGLGKMLIMGSLFHQIEPTLTLAAALSVQNPFTNKAYRDLECEEARKDLESDHGDPIILLNAVREWLELKSGNYDSRSSSSRKWCKKRGLEEQRFYEMMKLRRQFKDLLHESGLLASEKVHSVNEPKSSAERTLRHGELQLLKNMKRTFQETTSRKRKKLKLDVWQVDNEDEEDDSIDIKDVEFRITNDSSQMQKLVSGSTACSYKDLMMLKIILASGFYPQVAIPDEFNTCKSGPEQLFHTMAKPFVALHPTGYFGNHPQVLQLQDPDIVVPQDPGFVSKLPASSKHQLLCYVSLLETTKPYLLTTLRMPAAQTLFLFASQIDTNYDFSKLVFDSWLQLEFPLKEVAAKLLLKAAVLRKKWEKLLQLRLNAQTPMIEQDSSKDAALLENELSQSLPQFMHSEIVYTIKRLLNADRKIMYVGPGVNEQHLDPNPFDTDFKSVPNPVKGGMQVAGFITFNCLEDDAKYLYETDEEPYHCETCDLTASLSIIEKLQHSVSCQSSSEASKEPTEAMETERRNPNSRPYECSYCKKTLYLTPVEILRHKKTHTN